MVLKLASGRSYLSQTTSYILIGQGAVSGHCVPVPFLIQSVGQSILAGDGAAKVHISGNMLAFLASEVDLADPTRLFDWYEYDWWNSLEKVPVTEVATLEKAYRFHVEKVFFLIFLGLSGTHTNNQYG